MELCTGHIYRTHTAIDACMFSPCAVLDCPICMYRALHAIYTVLPVACMYCAACMFVVVCVLFAW